MLPNTTCSPSKKFSPMTMTIAPPVVQPSLGLMALIHGVAKQKSKARFTSAVSIQVVQQLRKEDVQRKWRSDEDCFKDAL